MSSTPEPGLSSEEAERRLADAGPNELMAASTRASIARQLVSSFANPLILVLLIASGVSAALGEVFNAALVATMVLLSGILNFVQVFRSTRAADALRSSLAPTASVYRDGAWKELPRREIVVGDLVRLVAGDLVPADVMLHDARDIHIHEASLTGESLPVEKLSGATAFFGTSVVSGTATATVTAVGGKTQFGDIVARLGQKAPETEFDRGLRRFGILVTQTVMALVLLVLLAGAASGKGTLETLLFAVSLAVGLTPEFLPVITSVVLSRGAVRMAREKVLVKSLSAIQNLGSIDVLCCDKTGTLTRAAMTVERSLAPEGADDARALALAALNSANESGIRTPLDVAILDRAHPGAEAWEKLDEIPFDFERRRVSVLVRRGAETLLVTKGAPESVFECCDENGTGRAAWEKTFREASAKGLRVLAVASRALPGTSIATKADEHDLTLVGFVTFSDPIQPDAAETISALRKDGVAIKLLTGDNELVAADVARAVGLNTKRILTGNDVDRATDGALAHLAETVVVFARLNPAQKNRLLVALRARGHVVGFIGDGINDAPSLHAADVGISVWHAADVARDAAQIVLLEQHLRVLHAGILEGRKAFANVFKYLLMGTSSNFGNMLSMAGAALVLPFLPMLPTQVLLNNLLYDLSEMTIPSDHVDPAWITKPRRWDIGVLRRFMLVIGPVSSFFDALTFAVLLLVFRAGPELFHTGWFVESLCTQTLVVFVIRTVRNPFRDRPSRLLATTTLGIVAVACVLPFTFVARNLGFVPLPATFFAFLVPAVLSYLVMVEAVKRWIITRVFAPPRPVSATSKRSRTGTGVRSRAHAR